MSIPSECPRCHSKLEEGVVWVSQSLLRWIFSYVAKPTLYFSGFDGGYGEILSNEEGKTSGFRCPKCGLCIVWTSKV
jgi:Domain of unknown function (DUF6487)